jgi:cell division transport system ATP-binding protein
LSGGEQQRVAIARALVVDPLVLLADEPTGNLDFEVTLEIMDLFKGANARGTTVLVATHNREMMRNFPRRVISLENGRLVDDSTP